MGWKTRPHTYQWKHTNIDQGQLHSTIQRVRGYVKPKVNADNDYGLLLHHIIAIEEGAKQGSILIDISYGAAFEIVEKHPEWTIYDDLQVAMEEIYGIIDLGTLAQDHIDRARNERAWMIKKGFTNDSSA